jgi:peptidoglycan pentaglycine glycine transferase (the first glycine)
MTLDREPGGPGEGGPAAAPMTEEDLRWDAFVDANPRATYLQLSGWARSKVANGWSAWPVEAGGPGGPIGARILLRRPSGIPWTFAYAPRGPIAEILDGATLEHFTERLKEAVTEPDRRVDRISHVRIDPEVEQDGPVDPGGSLRAALRELGWRVAPEVQPTISRIIDLAPDEAVLWTDLRAKWRQYVNKARSGGITVEDRGRAGLPEFHAIMTETAARAGTLIRTEASYRAIWDAFAPAGRVRLLFALDPDGSPQATLFLVRAGSRVVEPYGGMTAAGADSRANYLLKWEAIRSSREAGASSYDMWGLVHSGIRQFKEGFGGREVRLIGAFDLDLRRFGARAYRWAESVRGPHRPGGAG